jgi:hypothetical protein
MQKDEYNNFRHVFTISTGRSGQNTLSNILSRNIIDSHVEFEEPKVKYIFKGRLSNIERSIRRRFFETHELLGRGKVLTAYHLGEFDFIDSVAKSRLDRTARLMKKNNKKIHFDVSKFFGRGLHIGYLNLLDHVSLIYLVRDPILNMKSYLNRHKDFFLDNVNPASQSNILRMKDLDPNTGELYLWAWCEMALRYNELKKHKSVDKFVEIKTNDLNDTNALSEVFNVLDLNYDSIILPKERLNTNTSNGFSATKVTKGDIEIFHRFIEKIPADMLDKIDYLGDYNPNSIYQEDD